MTTAPKPTPKPELRWLPVNRLSVDMGYQRSLETRRSQELIARIAANFDWALFGTVMTAPLGLDTWELMDGQHRVEGAKRAGVVEVPSVVIQTPDAAARARIFRAANQERVTMHAFALHHAAVKEGDPQAVEVARLCAAVEIDIPRAPVPRASLKPGQCLALACLRKLARDPRRDLVARTLRTLRAAFIDEVGGLQAHLILGLFAWMQAHPHADELDVATALQRYGLDRLEKRVFSIGLGGARRYEAVERILDGVIPWRAGGQVGGADNGMGAPVSTAAPNQPAAKPQPVQRLAAPARFDPGKLTARPVQAVRVKARER